MSAKKDAKSKALTRRRLLQALAAMGISGPAALELVAQARKQVSPQILKTANALVDMNFSDERLQIIATALQRDLDQFQLVRDLEIDDLVEPGPIFIARR